MSSPLMKKVKYGNMITVLDALTFVDFYQHTDHWNRGDGTVLDRIMEKVEYADVVVANKVYIYLYLYLYMLNSYIVYVY
jgi:G3E family GTPase